jgi:hypothetical protein
MMNLLSDHALKPGGKLLQTLLHRLAGYSGIEADAKRA